MAAFNHVLRSSAVSMFSDSVSMCFGLWVNLIPFFSSSSIKVRFDSEPDLHTTFQELPYMFLSLAAAPPIAGFNFKKSVRSLITIFNFYF